MSRKLATSINYSNKNFEFYCASIYDFADFSADRPSDKVIAYAIYTVTSTYSIIVKRMFEVHIVRQVALDKRGRGWGRSLILNDNITREGQLWLVYKQHSFLQCNCRVFFQSYWLYGTIAIASALKQNIIELQK